MPRYVGLLYSIALDRTRRVRAVDLLAVGAAAGLSEVKPLLATGNLIFSAAVVAERELELRLQQAFLAHAGRTSPIIVRRAEDWLRLAAGNPFPDESARNGSLVGVRVQRDRLGPEAVALLAPYRRPDERVAVVDGNLWISFPLQMSSRPLLAALTPKRLGIGTIRNWNTVDRIARLLA